VKDFRPVFFFLKQYRGRYIAISILTFVSGFLESLNIAVILPIIYLFLGSETTRGNYGYLTQWATLGLGMIPVQDKLLAAVILLLGAFAIKSLVRILSEYFNAEASGKVQYELSQQVLEKYSLATYKFYLGEKQGAITYNLIIATSSVSRLLYRICHLMTEGFKVLAILVLLLTINFTMSLGLLFYATIFVKLMSMISKRISYQIASERVCRSVEQRNLIIEFIHGIKQIRVYNAIARWVNEFNVSRKRSSYLYARDLVWRAIPAEMMEITSVVVLFTVMFIMRAAGNYSFVDLMPVISIFAISILKIFPSVKSIGCDLMEMRATLPDVEAVYNVLQSDIIEKLDGQRIYVGFERAIEFKDVSFSYNAEKKILDRVNLSFPKNKVIALAGISGSGKTTIINLFLRLFEPTGGVIQVDDIPLNEYVCSSWFSKIGVVSQDSFVFHSTIIDNITFADPQYSTEDVQKAAQLANAHDFIMELPDGYQTVAGERGMKLSGGQQQRIAIARAMLRKPEILILDEATSALDGFSEREIQDSLKKISKICTLIVVAHRLSTIRSADKIYVLKDGIVAQQGRHDELIGKSGHYAALHDDKV
jgi:ABC-type multidrug transport system fused ATPase/permease subunit